MCVASFSDRRSRCLSFQVTSKPGAQDLGEQDDDLQRDDDDIPEVEFGDDDADVHFDEEIQEEEDRRRSRNGALRMDLSSSNPVKLVGAYSCRSVHLNVVAMSFGMYGLLTHNVMVSQRRTSATVRCSRAKEGQPTGSPRERQQQQQTASTGKEISVGFQHA